MYEQLIIIYIFLGIFALLHIIAFAMILRVKQSSNSSNKKNIDKKTYNKQVQQIKSTAPRIVLCRNCLSKYDAQNEICPKCGTSWRN